MAEDDLRRRLERLERLLTETVRRLEIIQGAVEGDPEARYMVMLTLKALQLNRGGLEVASAALRAERFLEARNLADGINRAIVESLAFQGPMNISEITRAVKKLRGTASRRIISERVRRLAALGLIREVGGGRGRRYELITGGRQG